MTGSAKQSIGKPKQKAGLLRRFAPRNDVGHASAISRRDAPEACMKPSPLKSEGAGNAGRWMRPQPRVQMKKAHEQVTTVTPESPGIPRAMVLTAYFVLSPVIGLYCHRHRRICLPPT
jgi:hypothetical protein